VLCCTRYLAGIGCSKARRSRTRWRGTDQGTGLEGVPLKTQRLLKSCLETDGRPPFQLDGQRCPVR
jgi:hypothetical protein